MAFPYDFRSPSNHHQGTLTDQRPAGYSKNQWPIETQRKKQGQQPWMIQFGYPADAVGYINEDDIWLKSGLLIIYDYIGYMIIWRLYEMGYTFRTCLKSSSKQSWRNWMSSWNRVDSTSFDQRENSRKQSQDLIIKGFNSLTTIVAWPIVNGLETPITKVIYDCKPIWKVLAIT